MRMQTLEDEVAQIRPTLLYDWIKPPEMVQPVIVAESDGWFRRLLITFLQCRTFLTPTGISLVIVA